MDLLPPAPEPVDPARLALEIARTADRLRSLSLVRLAADLPDGRPDGASRAAAAFALAQGLADQAADLAGRPRRRLPELPDQAAGDVIAVCGNDLVEQLRAARGRPVELAAACGAAVDALIDLRRRL